MHIFHGLTPVGKLSKLMGKSSSSIPIGDKSRPGTHFSNKIAQHAWEAQITFQGSL
jgi:hypothetical protein